MQKLYNPPRTLNSKANLKIADIRLQEQNYEKSNL